MKLFDSMKPFIIPPCQDRLPEEQSSFHLDTDELVRRIEVMKIPDPNPYGKTVKIKNVNIMLDQVINLINQLKD